MRQEEPNNSGRHADEINPKRISGWVVNPKTMPEMSTDIDDILFQMWVFDLRTLIGYFSDRFSIFIYKRIN